MALPRVMLWSVLCLMLYLKASDSFSFELRPTANVGLMQQPASQYYHFVEGGGLDISLVNSWSIRATYLERPVFRSAGFIDQDLFAIAQTGASFLRSGPFDVFGYAGVGRCWGYVKEEEPTNGRTEAKRNDYQMNALALSMEAAAAVSFLEFRLGHTLLVGKGSGDVYESKVAWPFAVYNLTISVPIGYSSRGRSR